MGKQEIDSLFHIANSSKQYGELVIQDGIERITQGSKGLGFLAALKFGEDITWTTTKNGVTSKFHLNKTKLISEENLADINIGLEEFQGNGNGTTITIKSTKEIIDELLIDLQDSRVVLKLVGAMNDPSFNVRLKIDQEMEFTTNKLIDFSLEQTEKQLFFIKYNPKQKNIEFFHKGELIEVTSADKVGLSPDYHITIELIAFFGPNVKKISGLHKSVSGEEGKNESLMPLIYVNRNLFNNDSLFDPQSFRYKRNSEIMPQMIGLVSISSKSKYIDFNSDRTNFVENSVTKQLTKDLNYLNERIQSAGSSLRVKLKASKKQPPTGKAKPEEKSSKEIVLPASIHMNGKARTTFYVPSDPILLNEYIYKAIDSSGKEIDKDRIEVTVDGEARDIKIIESIKTPRQLNVEYSYNDLKTGLVVKHVLLKFEKAKAPLVTKSEGALFTIESVTGYKIQTSVISKLMSSIEAAWGHGRGKKIYFPVIACSIRTVFEVAKNKLFNKRKYWLSTKSDLSLLSKEVKEHYNGQLLFQVLQVVILIKKNEELTKLIHMDSGLDISTLKQLLRANSILKSVKDSNVGAHGSYNHLTNDAVEDCANIAGLFAMFCDVLINIDEHTAKSFSITKVTAQDYKRYIEFI